MDNIIFYAHLHVHVLPLLLFIMIRSPKKRPPKHLEKMLFINHKEDVLLQDRLADLNLKSKLRIMDLDREKIQVRRELRHSRKKNIDVRDVAALGILTNEPIAIEVENKQRTKLMNKPLSRKHATSAPPGSRLTVISEDTSEVSSLNPSEAKMTDSVPRHRKRSSDSRFHRETSLPNIHESFDESDESLVRPEEIPKKEVPKERSRANSVVDESVGAYVLGEFRRMSQVVPSILMALSHKDDDEDELLSQKEEENQAVSLEDYEPDLHRVTKTVSAVKKLRHRMSVSKKLEAARPTKSLDQMIREKTEVIGEQDEYTDGTCVLMKRRLDKKRRNSATPGLSQPLFIQRRQSLFAQPERLNENITGSIQTSGRVSFSQQRRHRSQSVYNLPNMSRSPTVIGLVSNLSGFDNELNSPVMDEDEFLKRQKVLREIENYRRISLKVDEFLAARDSHRTGYEDIVVIK